MKNLVTKEFIKVVILSAVYSTILNAIFLFMVKGHLADPDTFGPFMYSSVIGATVLGIILAGVVYTFIGRFCPKSLAKWTVISLVVLIISFIPDVLLPVSTAADDQGSNAYIILALMFMHVIPAWVVIYKFSKYAKSLVATA